MASAAECALTFRLGEMYHMGGLPNGWDWARPTSDSAFVTSAILHDLDWV